MHPLRAPLLAALVSIAAAGARADALSDARQLAAAGQPGPALELIDKALQARASDAGLRFYRGVLLSDLGRDDEAMIVFTLLSQEYPELPDPLNNLAVLHAARGELDRARSLLEAALRNQPQHAAARENLGDVYLRLAIRSWESVARQSRPEPALVRKLDLARVLEATLATRP